jgi:pyruvate dehydrogenase E1 component beta subunit
LEDVRFMLAAALADPNPVLIFEHVMIYNRSCALPTRRRIGRHPQCGGPVST